MYLLITVRILVNNAKAILSMLLYYRIEMNDSYSVIEEHAEYLLFVLFYSFYMPRIRVAILSMLLYYRIRIIFLSL